MIVVFGCDARSCEGDILLLESWEQDRASEHHNKCEKQTMLDALCQSHIGTDLTN